MAVFSLNMDTICGFDQNVTDFSHIFFSFTKLTSNFWFPCIILLGFSFFNALFPSNNLPYTQIIVLSSFLKIEIFFRLQGIEITCIAIFLSQILHHFDNLFFISHQLSPRHSIEKLKLLWIFNAAMNTCCEQNVSIV